MGSAGLCTAGYLRIDRLGYVTSASVDGDLDGLYRRIAENEPDAVFFCDSSVFDDRFPQQLLDALLNQNGKAVIVPLVRKELEEWLVRRPDHPAAKAIRDGHPGFALPALTDATEWESLAAEYYIQLLASRKYLTTWEDSKFARMHGRRPDEQERLRIREGMHRALGPRGYLIAKKAFGAPLVPTLLTDEQVVYFAVATVVLTGRQTAILTKDQDLQEQFFKLTFLLTLHYRSMLFARRYATFFGEFRTHPMPMRNRAVKQLFTGENNILVERPDRMLAEVLPTKYTPVAIDVLVLGDKVTRMKFLAEREMTEVLLVKAKTRGMNTDALGGRNCHIWVAPANLPPSLTGCAAIAHDQRGDMGNVQMPLLDLWQAINTIEHFKAVRAL